MILLLSWLLFILAEVLRNYILIEKYKTRPDYVKSFLIRGIAAITHASLVMGVENWSEAVPVLLFQTTSFWLLFDPALNLLRGKELMYRGKNSGWLDKLPVKIYWSLKFIALITFLILLTNNF